VRVLFPKLPDFAHSDPRSGSLTHTIRFNGAVIPPLAGGRNPDLAYPANLAVTGAGRTGQPEKDLPWPVVVLNMCLTHI